ncbi:MAG: hypothetical protein K6B14_11390 [Lachnospiraceae bacterium]|nr:hypothetical protein [Lachnospiraceae bacterium]
MIYVFAMENARSGGPELLHQLVYVLNIIGVPAKIAYFADEYPLRIVDAQPIDIYEKYSVTTESDLAVIDQPENTVVLPEIAFLFLPELKNCKKMCWWLSVDGYITATVTQKGVTPEQMKDVKYLDLYGFRNRDDILHLAQSHYAISFLTNKMGVDKKYIDYLSDYLNDIYLTFDESSSTEPRRNMVVFNPQKGGKRLARLIDETKDEIFWFPLQGLTRERMQAAMRLAKVYIDVGEHPGKDRIPREAAISGCCVITGRRGAAAYHEDVPIPDTYKIDDSTDVDVAKVKSLVFDIFENFDERSRDFEEYRQMIRGEKEQFVSDVMRIFRNDQ